MPALTKAVFTRLVILRLLGVSEFTITTTGTVHLKIPKKVQSTKPLELRLPFFPTKSVCVWTEQSQPRQSAFINDFCSSLNRVFPPVRSSITLYNSPAFNNQPPPPQARAQSPKSEPFAPPTGGMG